MKIDALGIELELAPGWGHVDEIEVYTLAHEAGVGALQFSVALYANGELPNPSVAELRGIIEQVAEQHGLDAPLDRSWFDLDRLRGAIATFHSAEDFVRFWSVSDGRSFALCTYVCRWGSEALEVEACDAMVRTLKFSAPGVV